MKKRTRKLLFGIGLTLLSVGLVSGCTHNYCSDTDKARIMFALDPGISTFIDENERVEYVTKFYEKNEGREKKWGIYASRPFADNENFWQLTEWDNSYDYIQSKNVVVTRYTEDKKVEYLPALEAGVDSVVNKSIKTARDTTASNGGAKPTLEYYLSYDKMVLLHAMAVYNQTYNLYGTENEVKTSNITSKMATEVLDKVGTIKYFGNLNDNKNYKLFDSYRLIHDEVVREIGPEASASTDYVNNYVSSMTTQTNSLRSCMVTIERDGVKYGNFGSYNSSIEVGKKTWGDAWKNGPFEGLLVYPVAWMIDGFTNLFGGAQASAVPQLFALIVVTIIVRVLMFAATIPSTIQQQKTTALQPELAKIQAKYPNSNTNQAERQRLAQEQQALYKKHNVHPLLQLLVMVIQFPVFICVWGAMTGSAVLSTGQVLGLHLSSSIMSVLTNVAGWPGNPGWWTALVLFILMAGSQFLSMKVPQWIQKAKAKKVARLGKNPAQTQQNRTMNIFSYVMLAVIIFMGFSLPAAMGVYWFIGAIVSLAQSLITQAFVSAAGKKKKHKK